MKKAADLAAFFIGGCLSLVENYGSSVKLKLSVAAPVALALCVT
jgi:hypothetical protein